MEHMNEQTLMYLCSAENLAAACIESLSRNAVADVYLYGAGNGCGVYIDLLNRFHIPIRAILDTNRQGTYRSYPVLRYDDFLRSQMPNPETTGIVISAPAFADEIHSKLSDVFPERNLFQFDVWAFAAADSPAAFRKYLQNNWHALHRLYNDLQDDGSRQTLLSVLEGRVTGDLSFFRSCSCPDMYEPKDIYTLSGREVLVDLGAYDGDTLSKFIEACPDYAAAYGFEPEPAFAEALDSLSRREANRGKKLSVVKKGAWHQTGTVSFAWDGNDGGTIRTGNAQEGEVRIQTVRVDDAVREPISFLKMDIEGAELNALKGSEKQISANHPKLAICVYHKPEDLTDIWEYLRDLVPEYRFYLRHHGAAGADTVLYAVI